MNSSNYQIIQTMYDELKNERSILYSHLEEKRNQIAEIDSYLNGLLNKEESDLQVFLPRRVEDVYHDDIEKRKREKQKLTADCDEIEKQIHLDDNRIVQLENFLSDSSELHVKQISILDAQEKERQRIARDLHDTSLQNLTHLVHKVELSALYIDEDPVKAKLELATVEKLIHTVIEEIRNSIFALRPISLDDLGFKETMEKLITVLNQDMQFQISVDIDPIALDQSNPSSYIRLLSIYRIIQECVQNAIKHSGGTEIRVAVKEDVDFYHLCVYDNGPGFDIHTALKKDKHFGLSVIKERVDFLDGTLRFDMNGGTSIDIKIPKTDCD